MSNICQFLHKCCHISHKCCLFLHKKLSNCALTYLLIQNIIKTFLIDLTISRAHLWSEFCHPFPFSRSRPTSARGERDSRPGSARQRTENPSRPSSSRPNSARPVRRQSCSFDNTNFKKLKLKLDKLTPTLDEWVAVLEIVFEGRFENVQGGNSEIWEFPNSWVFKGLPKVMRF